MADAEGIRSPIPTQQSARSPKLRIYESLFLWNHGVDHVVAILRGMEKFPFAEVVLARTHSGELACSRRGKVGLGRVGWHTFRHSHSSLLNALGVDLKVQQELLRHADIRTTMNIYMHAVPAALREANSKVVRLVLPAQVA